MRMYPNVFASYHVFASYLTTGDVVRQTLFDYIYSCLFSAHESPVLNNVIMIREG